MHGGVQEQITSRLKVDYPDLTIIKLEQNYRSTGYILRCANELIACNPHVLLPELTRGYLPLNSENECIIPHCRNCND
jgi:superfamily I DNA/RNA helicase